MLNIPLFTRFMILLILFSFVSNAQIYVAVDGNNNNQGTIDEPLASITEALRRIDNVGDTIYVRGGVYELFSPIRPSSPGLKESYNKIWAYPGERPVLDYSSQPFNSAAKGIDLKEKFWHIKGLEIKGCGDNGIYITADSNKVEDCVTHHNRDTGIQISGGAGYNIIINCDSYANFDELSDGENADGFAAKLDIGPGNEFHGCRAWSNSDDGWDLYEGQSNVLIDSCWAFRNGFNIWGISNFAGDGNGFKLGGNFVPANHTITNSVAFDNRGKGFDQNHNTSGTVVYNCTAWRNSRNYVFSQVPRDSVKNIFKNNISFNGSVDIENGAVEENNSWQGFTVSENDFRSLDTALATAPRIWNKKLPQNDFLRLSESSPLIDAGIDVGFPFTGAAPDLGAFEFGTILGSNPEEKLIDDFTLYQNYPNPFNPTTRIKYQVPGIENITIKVYDPLGRVVKTLVNNNHSPGIYEIEFDAAGLSSGIYFYTLTIGHTSNTKKMILIK